MSKKLFYRKTLSLLIFTLILTTLYNCPVNSLTNVFEHKYTSFYTLTDKDVYPGSSAILKIGFLYNGVLNATNTYACITLPAGLVSENPCSPAYTRGEITTSISPGDIVEFQYKINIDRNISPGEYNVIVNTTYRYINTATILYEIHSITINISDYPELELVIIDTYWSPAGYPGSSNTDLIVIVENNCSSTILSGEAILYLPNNFYPENMRIELPIIDPYERATLVFHGITISNNIDPGTYVFQLGINAVLSTIDGVIYNDTETISFNVVITRPPEITLEIIDYGLTTTKPYPGLLYTMFYTRILSMDPRIIDSGLAEIKLLNSYFINNSDTALVVFNGPYSYGDVFTITSPRLILPNETYELIIQIKLSLLVFEDNSYYWVYTDYVLIVNLIEPEYRVYLLDIYWSNGKTYPGSVDESLNILVTNMMDTGLRSVYAKLVLSTDIFSPETLISGPYVLEPGTITRIVFNNIDIKPDAKPGNYTAKLYLYGILEGGDGSFINISLEYTVILEISNPIIQSLEIRYVKWSSGRVYPYTVNTGIEVVLTPKSQVEILYGEYTLITPRNIWFSQTGSNNYTVISNEKYGYGEYYVLRYNGICIDNVSGIQVFVLKTRLLVSVNNVETWINETLFFTLGINTPSLNITLIDKYWSSKILSGYVEDATLYVLARSHSIDRIEYMCARLIPVKGLEISHGLEHGIWVSNTPVDYGEYFTITFNNLIINTSREYVEAWLEINAMLSIGNTYYNISYRQYLVIPLDYPDKPIVIVSTRYRYMGSPARLLPNTHGLDFEVILMNTMTETIKTLIVEIIDPGPLKPVYTTSICSNVFGGSVCTVSYQVDVGDIVPGTYNIVFKLYMVIDSGGSQIYYTDTLEHEIIVDDPYKYAPRYKILDIYWGSRNPEYLYPGHRRAPLTIIIMNTGSYTSYDTYVELKPQNNTIRVLNNNLYCGEIGSGSTCSLTYYLDLRNTGPGILVFNITIYSYIRLYGSMNIYVEKHFKSIKLLAPETMLEDRKGIEIISMGWLNDWPVYPGSREAIYTVTIANLHPYTISSIYAELELPSEIYSHGINGSIDYLAGPIPSLGEASLSFTLDIGDLEPGLYTGYLRITYYVETGPTGYREEIILPIVLEISDPGQAIIVVQYGWFNRQPLLDTQGATYYVVFRNNEYPVIEGVLLNASLPSGITASDTNSSEISVAPETILFNPSTTIPDSMELLDILLENNKGTLVNPVISRGDYFMFILRLNLNITSPGKYMVHAILDFIDHWGSRQFYSVEIPLIIYGRPALLEFECDDVVYLVNGTTTYNIVVYNNYSSPIYNVYIVLTPVTPVLIPVDNIRYYPVIPAMSREHIVYKLYYNALETSFTTPGYSSNTAVFSLAIIYRDISGAVNIYNVSLAVLIKPFIDIVLSSDTRAEYSSGVLRVNGIILNRGIDKAYSVEVLAVYGNSSSSTFIGDLEPSSQAAFRIEVRGEKYDGIVYLIISYRDTYNTIYTKTYTLTIRNIEVNTYEEIRENNVPDYRLLVVIATILFLLIALAIIYRFMRHHTVKHQV